MTIKHAMSETVEIATATARDEWGKSTFGNDIPYKARVQDARQVLKSSSGEQVVSTKTVFIEGDVDVDPDSRITLPDGSTPDIIEVHKRKKADGAVHHTKIMLE